jgi:tetratricopeptide (TPR) repeat protein
MVRVILCRLMKNRLALFATLFLAIVVPIRAQEISTAACEAPTAFNPIGAFAAVDAAQALEFDGDLPGAANAYTQALKLSVMPNWPVYQARAQNWRWLGEYEMALDDINCAIRIAPWDLSLYRDRGGLYFITRENKLAEEDFRLVLSLLPHDTEANFFLGLILVQNEEHQEAVDRLTQVEAAYSGNAYFYSRRAWANYYIGQYEAAIDDSSRALKLGLTVDVDETYEVRARALDSAQDYENAIDEWTRLIELNPNHVQWYSNRGQSYLRAEQYDEAIADFTYLLEHRDQTYGYYWRGLAYIGQKSYDLALADFDRIDKLDPSALEGYIGRAQTYVAMREQERAIEEITAAIQMHPDSSGLYSYRAGFYIQQRDFEAALADYNTEFELEPPTAFSYYARATVYFYWHHYEQALDDLSEAIALDPEFADAYSMRGIANFLLENYNRSEADIERAQELSPHGMSIMTWRGYYFTYLQQDYEQAIALYTDV